MNTQNAIILAAGEAKRLRPFSYYNPKCLIPVNNITILENTLNNLSNIGVRIVYIVVGHLSEIIIKKIGKVYAGMIIEYIENPIYDNTNSMYSLFLGLKNINESTWVIEGDIFFELEILSKNLISTSSWLVDSSIKNMDGAFIDIDKSNRAVDLKIIKDISLIKDSSCKSIGIIHISSEDIQLVLKWLVKGIQNSQQNLYYDLIFADHFMDTVINTIDISGMKWYEIDTYDDLKKANQIFKSIDI